MFPDPLHPAIVHFPIAMAALTPLLAAALFFAIHTGRASRRSWLALVVLQAALVCTSWAANETGEREEERVEKVVAERHIEEHEGAAERFLVLTALVMPLAAAGLLAGPIGAASRGLTMGLALVILVAAGAVGHSGGALVYRYGAAAAYLEAGAGGSESALAHSPHEDPREEAWEEHDD